jgi:hypothetical protein
MGNFGSLYFYPVCELNTFMATIQTAWKKTDAPVKYAGIQTAVRLGDQVELRGLFSKRRGTVNYVPGISPPHSEMEHGGLYWVGVSFANGSFCATLVDPDTGCLKKKISFLIHGAPEAVPPIPPEPWE